MTLSLLTLFLACGDSTAQVEKKQELPEKTAVAAQPKATNPETAPAENPKPQATSVEPKTKKPTTHASNTSGMPDLLQGLATDGCDDGPGIFGAADYFYNRFQIDGKKVQGTETWILHPNKKLVGKWQAEGVTGSCKVVWNLKGEVVPVNRKGDLGIKVVNQLVSDTCPKEIVNKYEDTGKTIVYDVMRSSDGTAKFFFARSGKFVGQGHHTKNKLQFITDKSCRWF